MTKLVLLKAHVPGHTRAGHWINGYERPGQVASKPKPLAFHPRKGEKGERVGIMRPHKATPPESWSSPKAVATVLPGGELPAELNGVPLAPWRDHPRTDAGWDYVDGVNDDLHEPPLSVAAGKKLASGVIVEEPDGRVWLCAPTNAFGGYHASFPKGGAEDGLSLQANAIKECFEETGLQVEITGYVGDFTRTTSVARMYRARRVGGTPAAMGWESQAVHLVPKDQLYRILNMPADHAVAESIGAGSAPKQQVKLQQKKMF